ncbi:hypothetical protein ABRY23_04585 [Melioribacteraceae bacterium 4301-Me]|uniref:hypothetical protein n=1 Tax=Pyranulibacter aquaticus TaxID=3163344 RepID=UPI00359692B7
MNGRVVVLMNYKKIKYLHRLLLKRYGKGILTFVNVFYALIITILLVTLFNIIKFTKPMLTKQLIIFIMMMFLFGDLSNIFSVINLQTVISKATLKIYPLSIIGQIKLVYFCFLVHDRVVIYLLPICYLIYKFINSPFIVILIIIVFIAIYLATTLCISILFYLFDYVKYKYGIKNIALIIFFIILLPVMIGSSDVIYNNFIVDFIYNNLLKWAA